MQLAKRLAFVLFAIVMICGALSVIGTTGPDKKRELREALNNTRNIYLALLEFEQSYGTFPNDDTAPEVLVNTKTNIPLGSQTSNDYFRQLFAAKICTDERIFYTKTSHTQLPDNQIDGAKALDKGECGVAYVISESQYPNRPILLFGLIPDARIFDTETSQKSTQGYAFLYMMDGSVQTLPIDKSGRVWIDGKDLFDPTQPFWNGKPPVIKWPDL